MDALACRMHVGEAIGFHFIKHTHKHPREVVFIPPLSSPLHSYQTDFLSSERVSVIAFGNEGLLLRLGELLSYCSTLRALHKLALVR